MSTPSVIPAGAPGKPSSGSGRLIDWTTDYRNLKDGSAWTQNSVIRGGTLLANVGMPSAPAAGGGIHQRGDRLAYVIGQTGGGAPWFDAVARLGASKLSGTARRDERFGYAAYHIAVAAGAWYNMGTYPTWTFGIDWHTYDARVAANYAPFYNANINSDAGFGVFMDTGSIWRFRARNTTRATGDYTVDVVLDWPTANASEYVLTKHEFFGPTAKRGPYYRLSLNGVLAVEYDLDGVKLPRLDYNANTGGGPGTGIFPTLRNQAGANLAAGEEIWLADLHYVAGPDEDGVHL